MRFHPQAVAYYQMLDEALGEVMNTLNGEDLLMVVSDHGFQSAQRQFYIQDYLYQKGLLRVRDSHALCRAQFYHQATGLIRKLTWTIGLQGFPTLVRRQLYHLGVKAYTKESVTLKIPGLDWANSHAWIQSASGNLAGYADILLDDTVTEEQIGELLADLREMRDLQTGQLLIKEAHRDSNLWDTCKPYGIHHPEGVLYLYGTGVKHGVTLAPAHVYDVVPTILTYRGLPLPEVLEGHVMEEAFARPIPPPSRSDNGHALQSKLRQLLS
jgi:predicted AlkP superfamily phosphohydrolase/phosphomutase